MDTFTRTTLAASAAFLSLTAAACGGGNPVVKVEQTDLPASTTAASASPSDAAAPTSAPADSATTLAEPTTTPAAGIASFKDVQPAVIQIIAEGTFRSVEDGQTVTGAGSGTGFIIGADGIAVTNNHVVTGAAKLTVYIGGDTSTSYNARVLGVSECNDLAVIDIAESAPLPTLEWSALPITPGTSVYAAGFPLGNPEYTLTAGIIGKAESAGNMPWASIDSAIEHDAVIQPGNSGGPLVDEFGDVIAVNYAFKGGITSARYQSIRADLAQTVADRLKNGDFESLGINGEAFVNEESGLAGVWVAGVSPGSPAADVGLLAGDIITAMNGLPVGTDGTMADYCDVLRTAGTKPIDLEVTRYDTAEVLRGEIRNEDKPLVATLSFADQLGDLEGATSYAEYTEIVDDTGTLKVAVPAEWAEWSTAPHTFENGTTVPLIVASPSLQSLYDTWEVPGLFFIRYEDAIDFDDAIAFLAPTDCVDGGTFDYSDSLYVGKYKVFNDCGGIGTTGVIAAATPPDGSYTAVLMVQAITEADLEALDQAFASFVVAE